MSVEKNLGTLFLCGACPTPHSKLSERKFRDFKELQYKKWRHFIVRPKT